MREYATSGLWGTAHNLETASAVASGLSLSQRAALDRPLSGQGSGVEFRDDERPRRMNDDGDRVPRAQLPHTRRRDRELLLERAIRMTNAPRSRCLKMLPALAFRRVRIDADLDYFSVRENALASSQPERPIPANDRPQAVGRKPKSDDLERDSKRAAVPPRACVPKSRSQL